MKKLMDIKAETLLAIGGAYIFLVSAVFFIFIEQQADSFDCLQYMSNFECGQYYFNHDDDPAGPYDLEKAMTYYEAALAEDESSNELLWYQAGRIDFIEGRFDEALRKFDKQLEYHGESVPNVYYMIGLTHAYRASWYDEEESWRLSEENFLKYLTMASYVPWPRVDLAWVYFSQGKYEEMKPVLEKSMEYFPDNAWLLNMYGLAVMNTAEDKSEAAPYFRKALESAEKLTPEDWGLVYPGNDPSDWPIGLSEFKKLITANLDLVE